MSSGGRKKLQGFWAVLPWRCWANGLSLQARHGTPYAMEYVAFLDPQSACWSFSMLSQWTWRNCKKPFLFFFNLLRSFEWTLTWSDCGTEALDCAWRPLTTLTRLSTLCWRRRSHMWWTSSLTGKCQAASPKPPQASASSCKIYKSCSPQWYTIMNRKFA